MDTQPEQSDEPTAQSRQLSPPAPDQSPKTASEEDSKQELQDAIRGSNQILARANTAFQLFPDTITLDRAKVTITKRTFFRTADVMSMRIEDVLNVTCSVGPMLGSVNVVSRVMNQDQTTSIGKFWRADAKRLKRVMQGYIIALQRNIDCSSLPTKELARMLERLGADNHPA